MTFNYGDIVLSKFKVDEWIGEGMYTQILKVTHLSTHDARTLKMVRPGTIGLDSSRLSWLAARFRLEADLASQISSIGSHPNLLGVYGYYELDGLPVLERQYASRGSLAGLLEAARYAGKHILLVRALKIAIEASDGLAALHNRDIVHRDVKPSNILIDANHFVHVSDLYLAQIPKDLGLGQPPGPPSPFLNNSTYRSPEQVRSRPVLTPPSDIFSLGVIIFEMLAGENYNALQPGTRLRSFRPDTPEWLDDLINRMLAPEPEKRPYSGAVASALLRAGLDSMISEGEVSADAWEDRSEYAAPQRKPKPLEPTPVPSGIGEITGPVTIADLSGQEKQLQGWQLFFARLLRSPAIVLILILLAIIIRGLVFLIFKR